MNNEVCQIRSFQERDIDLLLAEELRVNPEFAAWFVRRVAPDQKINVPAARTRVSVCRESSESDVVACFDRDDGGLHRVFIEDKIGAQMMPEQLERYLKRAAAERGRQECDSYSVVLFAPDAYGSSLPGDVVRMSFEEAANALDEVHDSPHSSYKAAFLREAVNYARGARSRGNNPEEMEPHIVEWWDAVDLMLDNEFPGYFAPRPTRYMTEVYYAPKSMKFMPQYLRVDFKGHLGEVDLAFRNVDHDALRTAVHGIEVPGRIVRNRKSTSIRIEGLQKFTISDGPAVVDTRVREAYAATQRLVEFWRQNMDRFDRVASVSKA